MKNTIIITTILLACVAVYGCKKEKAIKPFNITLGVPFTMTIRDTGVLIDDDKKVQIHLGEIRDYRLFGDDCSFATGGYAAIPLYVQSSDTSLSVCEMGMPGCTAGDEYDTINLVAPKCIYKEYKIYLLKLNPYDSRPESQDGYSVKYVINAL